MANLDRWLPIDLLIEVTNGIGSVLLVGGILLLLLGLLGGSPLPLDEPFDNGGLIGQGFGYAPAGAALLVGGWLLRRRARQRSTGG
jgi:hypothetical protein